MVTRITNAATTDGNSWKTKVELVAERRIVIVEFPSMEKVREWYASPDYAKALELQESALHRRLLFVEGI